MELRFVFFSFWSPQLTEKIQKILVKILANMANMMEKFFFSHTLARKESMISRRRNLPLLSAERGDINFLKLSIFWVSASWGRVWYIKNDRVGEVEAINKCWRSTFSTVFFTVFSFFFLQWEILNYSMLQCSKREAPSARLACSIIRFSDLWILADREKSVTLSRSQDCAIFAEWKKVFSPCRRLFTSSNPSKSLGRRYTICRVNIFFAWDGVRKSMETQYSLSLTTSCCSAMAGWCKASADPQSSGVIRKVNLPREVVESVLVGQFRFVC